MKKKIKALLLLGLVFLGGCGQASAPSVSSAGTDSQSIDLFAMDTAMRSNGSTRSFPSAARAVTFTHSTEITR